MRPGLPDRPGAIASADFNLDGKADLIEANFEAGDLSFFQEDALGDYLERSPSPFLVGEGPTFLAVADLNKDNRPDLVVVNRLSRTVSIKVSDADLTLKSTADLLVGRAPQAVAVADFNRDGRMDVAVTSETDDGVYLFYGKGDGTFTFARLVDARTSAQKTDATLVGAFGIASGDFDRDGKVDLAVTQFCTDQLAILRGNGNGTFQPATSMAVGRHPTYLSTARLGDDQLPGNLDDFQDLVVLLTGGAQSDPKDCKRLSGAALPGGIVPVLGNGDGTFTLGTEQTESSSDEPVQLAVGRLFGSNFDDVVVANFGTSTLRLYPGDGSNGFLSPIALGGAGSTLRNPNAVALVDRDADGLPDRIAASNFSGNSMTLFDGGGGNPFLETSFSPVTATRAPVALAAATLDASPSTDLAVLSAGNDSLQTFEARNNGFFFKRRQTPFPSGSGPTAIALADFNKDLTLDAVFAVSDVDGSAGPSTSPAFTVMTGSGLGTFGAVVGICSGGSSAGESCTSDAGCPGGACSFSLTIGTCQGGTRDGKACSSDTDCPTGSCLLPAAPTPLQGIAQSLLATDFNLLDADLDGVVDASDNCPSRYNPLQTNTRGVTCNLGVNDGQPCTVNAECPGGTCTRLDSVGDDCDSPTADPDADGVVDFSDNCLDLYNPLQIDTDSDGVGDSCDNLPDVAALEPSLGQLEFFARQVSGGGFEPSSVLTPSSTPDSVVAGTFTPGDTNPDLLVTEPAAGGFQVFAGDGKGGFAPLPLVSLGGSPGPLTTLDANSQDLDLDGVLNTVDNCPTRYNPTQLDTDRDGAGDACSQVENPDGDTSVTLLAKPFDNCPDTYNPIQTDTDNDGLGDACDSNPSTYNPADDEDADGVPNSTDNCPTRYNPNQENFNTDSVGNICGQADDPDGDFLNTATIQRDNCPDTYNPDQADSDADGVGDACEDSTDLAVIDPANGTLQVVIQAPPGSWVPQPPLTTGLQPTSVTAVDLNGDGRRDLVTANTAANSLSIFLSNGDGTFLYDPCFDVPVLPGPKGVEGGFFRRDPLLDFAEVAMLSPSLNTPVVTINILSERADIDGSGRVNGRDLAFWARGFGLSRKDSAYPASRDADINLDGRIDGLDLVFMTAQFGEIMPAAVGCGSATPIRAIPFDPDFQTGR
jgi:hypothetical protein